MPASTDLCAAILRELPHPLRVLLLEEQFDAARPRVRGALDDAIVLSLSRYQAENVPTVMLLHAIQRAARTLGYHVAALARAGFTHDDDRIYCWDSCAPHRYIFTSEVLSEGAEFVLAGWRTPHFAHPLVTQCLCGAPLDEGTSDGVGIERAPRGCNCQLSGTSYRPTVTSSVNYMQGSCFLTGMMGVELVRVLQDNGNGTNYIYRFIAKAVIPHLYNAWHYSFYECPEHVPVLIGSRDRELEACPVCNPPAICESCNRRVSGSLHSLQVRRSSREGDPDDAPELVELRVCATCARREGTCRGCNHQYLRPRADDWREERNPRGYCRACIDENFNAYRVRSKRSHLVLTPESFVLENLPFRPTRLMSVETELGGTSRELNIELYANGLSPWRERVGYHPGGHNGLCHIESDGSCDGELVVQRFLPSDLNDMGLVHRVYELFNQQMDTGTIWLDARCGGHQHIDASMLTRTEVWAVYKVFCYIEDLLFRLGSAWWKHHRTMCGSGYAIPVEKRLSATRVFSTLGHGNGLNLARFAGSDEPERGMGTLEFRLWQSTANFPLLRTQMALTQGVVAAGQHLLREENLPTTSRGYRNVPDVGDTHAKRLMAQMKWLLKNVPLTDADRRILLHCAKRAPLGMDSHDIKKLMALEYQGSTKDLRAPSMAMARQGSSYAPQFPNNEPGYDPDYAEESGYVEFDDDEPFYDEDDEPYHG